MLNFRLPCQGACVGTAAFGVGGAVGASSIEKESHDRLIDDLSAIEMKRSALQEFTANMIK